MSEGDGDDDPVPLADLVCTIEEREDADDDVWARLAEVDADGRSRAAIGEPRAEPVADRTPAWATISDGAKALHGSLAVLALGVALAIYVAAAVGALPRAAWILGLPPFALGVVLLLPVLAWYLGVWDPTRIA